MKNWTSLFLAWAFAFVAPSVVWAQANVPMELKGAKDSAVVSRYAGSIQDNAATETFAAVRVPTGPGRYGPNDAFLLDKAVPVEGRLSAHFYIGPKDRGALEVFRNYRAALGQGGFTTLYSCEMRVCDEAMIQGNFVNEVIDPRKWAAGRIPPGGAMSSNIRFFSAKATRNGTDTYVMVFVGEPDSVWQAPTAVVIVVEPKPMDTGKVTVSTEQLHKGLAAEGRMALYGIYFDTGRAEVKPESKPQLDEIARLLATDRAMKLLVVGHTDNQGAADANIALSQRRADAVVASLVSQHKVDPSRLRARGVANHSPVATNRTEAGRAKNRRVELVEQ